MVAKAGRKVKQSSQDEQLRRESPAYQPKAGWEVLEPQAMNVVVSARFDARTARRLLAVAQETGRTPGRLIRDWTLERLASLSVDSPQAGAAIREAHAAYDASEDRYEALRQRYRPDHIQVLLVGESRPAGGTFFYLANSYLYYATHEAFQLAYGPMPEGTEFLELLRDRGVWLYDLADKPVDRMRGRPRRAAVQARVVDLVDLLRTTRPPLVVGIKRNLESTLRQAAKDADLEVSRLRFLPFPLYQWRAEYIRGLAELIGGLKRRRRASITGSKKDRPSS
jgi:hypothetical protein